VCFLCSAILVLLLAHNSYSENSTSQNFLISGKKASAAGEYERAENDLRRAIDEAGAADDVTALALGELGGLLLTEGRFEESEPVLNRAIGMIRSNRALNQRQLPLLLGMLGHLYQKTGKLRESEKTLDEALQLGAKLLADSPLHMADLFNDLGVLHLKTGNRNQAEKNFKKALELAQKSSTPDSGSHLGPILANLASVYYSQQEWSLAESAMLQSLHVTEESLGPEHPDICPLLNNLGVFYFLKGRLAESEVMHRRAFVLRRKAFGQENPQTALSAANLAEVLAFEGKSDEAGMLFAEALQTQERTLGLEGPEVAATLEKFASFLRRTNNDVLAGEMEHRANSIRDARAYTVSVK